MAGVLDTLKTEHHNFAKVLEILDGEIALFEKAEEPDYDLIEKVVDYLSSYPDISHHPKEDLLFEKLVGNDPAISDLIGNLASEHLKLAKLISRFKVTVKNVLLDAEQPREEFIGAAKEFIGFFKSHMMLEELRYFPLAERILSPEDWQDIEVSLQQGVDPLFDKNFDAPLNDLRNQIFEIAENG